MLRTITTGDIWSKIAVYFVIGPPLVFLGASMLLATGGEGFSDGLVSTYASLYKVPSNILTSSNSAEVVVLNIMWFTGTIFFGAFLGILSEEISEKAKQFRDGFSPLPLVQHTVLLGWSPMLVPVLKQIAIAHKERQGQAISKYVAVCVQG